MRFDRFAIYHVPEPGPLADFGTSWLGWDLRRGLTVAQPACALDLVTLTDAPRRYGFHATLKAPFRLAEGHGADVLADAMHDLARRLPPVVLTGGLVPASEYGFLALVPAAQSVALDELAAALVRGVDHLRAPLTDNERARRRPEALTPRQRAQLDRWGYPWIFADFRFHMTLTDPVADPAPVMAVLQPLLPPGLGRDHKIDRVALVGEDANGCFHMIEEVMLSG